MVRFIKTISFVCETQSLIAVLTLYVGFHAFSTTTLTSSPPAKETIYHPVHPKWGMHSWHLSADGKGVCLVTSLVGSGDRADCVVGADCVIFCEAGMWEELSIFDGLPACRWSHTMERQKSKCSTVCSVIAGRSC